jgi:addiction module HigA family antidote
MTMHNPPHPGSVLKELCLDPLGLSITEAAEGLGVSRKTLSALINGHFGISSEKFIIKLNAASVATRYPDDLSKLQAAYTKVVTEDIIKQGKEVLQWVKRQF